MTIETEHQGYSEHYEQQQQQSENSRLNNSRPIHSNPSDPSPFHHQDQQQQQPQQEYHPSFQQSSPHRIMSSQPTTPKPSSVSPSMDNTPLEQQKYTNTENYSPHTNTIRTTAHRKESVVPNINETCPSFGPTEYNHNVISMDRHSIIDVRLHTKVDRGFFLAEEDWTCYRRNYFQVSGSFSLEGVGILYEGQEFPCLVKDPSTGLMEEIHCFMLGVSARLSDCDKSIQLIQHTPKRDKGPQTTPTPKPIRPGGNIGFSAVGSSQSIVTFERLQFKTATANNGKRRAAQQYYVIIVELLAKLRNGNTISVATTKSSALVVRGRSPGHYAETDSGVSHTITPKQRGGNNHANIHHHQPQQPPVAPFGRPTAYAGASPNLFQPTEYMPYDYHGVTYPNYGHLPHNQPPQQQQQQQQYPHPTNGSPSVPMMHSYGAHDRQNSSHSTESAYPNNNNQQQQEYNGQEVKEESTSSPYYWQRNADHHNETQEEQHQHHAHQQHQQQQQQQEHWSRMRMASNQTTGSSSVDNSQHGSPYMSHPPPQHQHQQQPQHHQEHHSYYAPQHHQPQYGNHPYNGHHAQSLPPPPPTNPGTPDGHYQYNNYDWQPRPKMQAYYESDRRHEYNERQGGPQSPAVETKATIVK